MNYGGLFENWEIALAKKLISEFQRRWKYLRKEDFEDLLQECLIHWLEVREEYDAKREATRKTFMAKVLRNKLNNVVAVLSADKRKAVFHSISLDEAAGIDEDAIPLIDKIPDKPEDPLKAALNIDLSRAYQKLTPKQKELYRLIGEEGMSPTEVSRHLKINRRTVYDELKRIKKVFTKQGLKEYLK